MFIQIHMLQSLPPGNLNRDETGQPKKCVFGGVTRGRISSQCLKHNIRHSLQFKKVFGDALSIRTTYLPRMVAEELRKIESDIDKDVNKIKATLASKFKAERGKGESDDEEIKKEEQETQSSESPSDITDQTGQLVFFPPPFAKEIAELILKLRKENNEAYKAWINGKKKDKNTFKKIIEEFEREIFKKSESLTVDIGMFGRMTTSDLVVNVEAACQVAHAISTHEVLIESDYFTAMDDRKSEFAETQTERTGAAFLGSGEKETFFNSAVYYKYLNLDVEALKKHLSWQGDEVASAAATLVEAAAFGIPTGKQNSFAAHGLPELILIEASEKKRPLSYANAFLKAVEGGNGRNLMTESVNALKSYIDTVAAAYAPSDLRRVLFAVGPASVDIASANKTDKFDDLIKKTRELIAPGSAGASK